MYIMSLNDFNYIKIVFLCECYSKEKVYNTFEIKIDLYFVKTAEKYHHHQELLPLRCSFIIGSTRKM